MGGGGSQGGSQVGALRGESWVVGKGMSRVGGGEVGGSRRGRGRVRGAVPTAPVLGHFEHAGSAGVGVAGVLQPGRAPGDSTKTAPE